MAEIIKAGKKTSDRTMDITCKECGCVYRVSKHDVRFCDVGKWYWNYHYTKCPNCERHTVMQSGDVDSLKIPEFA